MSQQEYKKIQVHIYHNFKIYSSPISQTANNYKKKYKNIIYPLSLHLERGTIMKET